MGLVGFVARWVGGELSKMVAAVQTLNERMAAMLARMENHNEILKDHSDRLKKIESKGA